MIIMKPKIQSPCCARVAKNRKSQLHVGYDGYIIKRSDVSIELKDLSAVEAVDTDRSSSAVYCPLSYRPV